MFRTLITLLVTLALVLFIRHNFYQSYKFVSVSMKPSILIGDVVLANKWLYKLEDPRRGDIILFRHPKDEKKDWIKRLIGLPGETLELKKQVVYINGSPLKEPYVLHSRSISDGEPSIPRDNFGPIKIPLGNYFLMGDNRENSQDSRYIGFIPKKNLIGKADWIINSIDENGDERPDRFWEPFPQTTY